MGRIHVLSEHVANKIAAGEVVERPASVVKELIENSLDAGASRVRVVVEGGGKKLIQVVDDGCGMVRDDAMLAFERHATSKLKDPEDLLCIATLGFRGEALPSIASVARVRLETRATGEASGSVMEIAGGKILKIEEAGLPQGTSIAIRDLFFNTPARKKFLKSETTELSHIASLVTHYALANPAMHWEMHSATNALLVAPPVTSPRERIYQVFGNEMLEQLIPLAAQQKLERIGLPKPPPWLRKDDDEVEEAVEAGDVRLHGFISKPEVQKLNRNSIFVFVNGRLIRDRLVQHALIEAYRNILPPALFPVVLLFLEMPYGEVDVNVHPSKTEVRFRQPTFVHDFVRESVRVALAKARPIPQFMTEIHASAKGSPSLTPGTQTAAAAFALQAEEPPVMEGRLQFGAEAIQVEANAALPVARFGAQTFGSHVALENGTALVDGCDYEIPELPASEAPLSTLKPVGQIRESFILAVNSEGLWIIDQHVAHERVLFEKVVRQRASASVETQQLLMPLILELTPGQQAVFSEIAEELRLNGFEAEPFGSRTVAIKAAPAGIRAEEIEKTLNEVLDSFEREQQAFNLEHARTRIAASIACHAAIKVNMPLSQEKMEWLLAELAKTEHPMTCPHGRPVVLRYSVKDIQKAFKRI